jgi:hypothetical protein
MSKLILPIVDVATKVAAAGFTGWQIITGTAVIGAESRFDAYAVNVIGERFRADGKPNPAYRSLDIGLFQVNTYWHPGFKIADLLDSDRNIAAARLIFLERWEAKPNLGWNAWTAYAWSAWVTYKNGLHKPFESAAVTAAREAGLDI